VGVEVDTLEFAAVTPASNTRITPLLYPTAKNVRSPSAKQSVRERALEGA
jgi:hypothetical protein